jgi:hypothetical protein
MLNHRSSDLGIPPESQHLSGLVLVCCSDYHCSHYIAISGDRWPDDVRLSDLEPRFVCQASGKRGADVRPDFDWDKLEKLTRGF